MNKQDKIEIQSDLLKVINNLNLSVYGRSVNKETSSFVKYFRDEIQTLIRKYK